MPNALRTGIPAGAQGPYTMLRYHMGWCDEEGKPLARPAPQGKALRPTLCMFACEALGGDWRQALPAAIALEYIHNFSLIHDDIQDGDTERRHRPTLWYLWGRGKALAAGNTLRTLADSTLLSLRGAGVPLERALHASRTLTERYLQMIEGQYLDLSYEKTLDITVQDYLEMVSRKTGALIQCSLEVGALIATGDNATVQALADCGMLLGIAFQARDDVLGIWGDEVNTGKMTGNDIWRKKKSLPVVFALEHAQGAARDILLSVYRKESLEKEDVERVMGILEEVKAQQYAQDLALENVAAALRGLEGVPMAGWAKRELSDLATFVVQRQG